MELALGVPHRSWEASEARTSEELCHAKNLTSWPCSGRHTRCTKGTEGEPVAGLAVQDQDDKVYTSRTTSLCRIPRSSMDDSPPNALTYPQVTPLPRSYPTWRPSPRPRLRDSRSKVESACCCLVYLAKRVTDNVRPHSTGGRMQPSVVTTMNLPWYGCFCCGPAVFCSGTS